MGAVKRGVVMPCYFFSGNRYIRVTRGEAGAGTVDPGYPAPISDWGWGAFGANGIDAALYSGSKCYFFSGSQYIRVTRGETGAGTVDPGYPAPISSNWGWGAFGANGIDAALYSGSKCYFFSGNQYIRVTRGETGAGTVDPGYPASISPDWSWGTFGANGIDAALYSVAKCYFFSGSRYIRVTRGDTGAGTVDAGYPAPISNWGWGSFGASGIKAALYSGTDQTPPPVEPSPPVLHYENGRVWGVGFRSNLPCSVTIISGQGLDPSGPWVGNIEHPGISIESPCDGTPGQYFVVQATNSIGQSATLQINC
jgi:Hemopexin